MKLIPKKYEKRVVFKPQDYLECIFTKRVFINIENQN